jgi:stringent starvation protein B
MGPKLREKQSKLEAMLQQGVVMVYVDAHKPGVRLPPHLKAQPYVALNLSYRFSPADLTVNAWGARATLSFEGRPFAVAIPWSSVFAIQSQVTMEFWIFPEDVPEAFLEQEEAPTVEVLSPAPGPGKRAAFQLVYSAPPEGEGEAPAEEGISAEEEGETEGKAEETSPKPTPPHLKLLH